MFKYVEEKIDTYLFNLNCWIKNNGWAGWDPYDIWDNPIGLWLIKREKFSQRVFSFLLSKSNEYFPLLLRKSLKIKSRINAKAMGLFASGFLELEAIGKDFYKINGEAGYEPCFRWLEDSKVVHFGGVGWGYPFDWQTRTLIPRNTPTIVNSTIIGNAYWLKYKYHHDKKALHQCENICRFIIGGLNRNGIKKNGSFCFSYTPLDNFQVHNANLFGAEFLIRIGIEVGRIDWINTGLNAAYFSISEVRDDGTLNYWSNEQSVTVQQDTYHSGFEIRAINSIACLTGEKTFREVGQKYFQTWCRDFFLEDGIPCFVRSQRNTLEVHSCAEALMCTTMMFESNFLSKKLFFEYTKNILSAVSKLWVKKKHGEGGYFASKINTIYGFKIKIKIPYIRWGQAWMFRSLCQVLTAIKK